jgi:hypothetical protein
LKTTGSTPTPPNQPTTTTPEPTRLSPEMAAIFVDLFQGGVPEVLTKPLTIGIMPNGLVEARKYANYEVFRYVGKDLIQVRIHHQLPYRFFAQIVGLFKQINTLHRAEALVYIWLDAAREGNDAWRITVPKQRVSGGNVTVDEPRPAAPEQDQEGNSPFLLWGHIHSHNTMGAFFSSVDDSSEQQDGLIYGVVGKIDSYVPETKWRIRAAGSWAELKQELVCGSIPSFPAPPAEWLDQIKTHSTTSYYSGKRATRRWDVEKKQWEDLPEDQNEAVLNGWRNEQQENFNKDRQRMGLDPIPSQRLLPGPGYNSQPRILTVHQRIRRKNGRVDILWQDGSITWSGKYVKDYTQAEQASMRLEGVDWGRKDQP